MIATCGRPGWVAVGGGQGQEGFWEGFLETVVAEVMDKNGWELDLLV